LGIGHWTLVLFTGGIPPPKLWEILLMLRIWDQDFENPAQIAKDPRCTATYAELLTLLKWGVPLEHAVRAPEPKRLVCWGQEFRSLAAVAKDPRCGVTYLTLAKRLAAGVPLEKAVVGKQIVCWGEVFRSLLAVSQDARCGVSYVTLVKRTKGGMSPEQATCLLPLGLEEVVDHEGE